MQNQLGTVLIPTEVETELQCLRHPTGIDAIKRALQSGWLVPTPAPLDAPHPHQIQHLDLGERSAIRLALALHADRVIIDESDGRAAAFALGLCFTGLIGILIEARKRGQIASLKADLQRLKSEARFFIDARLERRALAAVGE